MLVYIIDPLVIQHSISDMTPVLIHLSQVCVQVEIIVPFVEDYWLT